MGCISILGALLAGRCDLHAFQTSEGIVQAATAQIQTGHFAAARELIKQALSTHLNNPDLWNLLGIAETELHADSSARSDFENGLRLAPDSVSLHENLGLLYLKSGDYATAEKVLARAIALGSTNPAVRLSLASARLHAGDPQRALADLKTLEPAFANVAAYWDERGRAESVKDPVQAEKCFSRALDLKPDDAIAANGAASAAERENLDEKALAYLIKARQAHPDDVTTLTHFGAVCIRRDLGVDALAALNKAHQLDPANNSVLFLLARANISLSNWQAAYDLFSEFAKRVPAYAPTYYAMGWVDTKLDHTGDARRQFQKALQIDPKLTDVRFELAQLELNDGNLEAARGMLRTVLHENPTHAKANLAMGDLLMRQNDLNGAETHLQTAVHSDPNLAAAHYKLAMLYLRKHETAHAQFEKEIAAKLNTEAEHASKTQLKLIIPDDPTQ